MEGWFEIAMKRTTIHSKGGCWLYNYDFTHNGYGRLKIDGKRHRIHRLSFKTFRGDVPDGLMVCHRCDVRNCWNPDHLFLGTALDNNLDAIAKGRTRGPFLTQEGAQSVVDRFAALGNKTAVAAEMGIHPKMASAVILGRTRHDIDRSILEKPAPMPSPETSNLIKTKLSDNLRKTYSIIEAVGEAGISISDLSVSLFGPEKGPSKRNISTTIITVCRLRKAVKPEGIAIPVGYSDRRYRVQEAA